MPSFSESSLSSLKDTIIMFITISPQSNYQIWGILMPYYFSYLKHFNPEITFNQIFASSCFFYLGILFCSWCYPSMVSVLGLNNLTRLSGTLYAVNAVAMNTFSSFEMVCVSIGVIGFCIKIMFVNNMLYFTCKYKENATKLIGIANFGYIALSFIWSYLYFYFINPGNETMTEIAYNGTTEERYFKWEIAQRFQFTLNLHGLSCFIISMICSFLITDPEKYKSNIDKLWAWITNKDRKAWESIWKERTSIDVSFSNKSNSKVGFDSFNKSHNDSNNSDKLIELLANTETKIVDKDAIDEIVQQELRKPKFWILLLVSILKLILVYYMIDMNKILGLIILKDDKLITQAFNVISISLGIFYSFIIFTLDRIGFMNGYIISSVIVILTEIYFMFFTKEFPLLFVVFLFFSIFNLAFIEQINNLILIHFYSPEVTLQLQKIFDFNLFIANVIVVLCNTFLFKQNDLFPIFSCYLIFDVIGLILTVVYLRPTKKRDNEDEVD